MQQNAKAMVLASFAADSLALGAHWIYDTAVIDNDIGRVDNLRQPPPDSFHPAKEAGEFTHYGDQTLVLLSSIAEKRTFDLDRFARDWQALFDGYTGYRDHATKETLKNFAGGKTPASAGSASTDLGGAVRIAPLACLYRDNRDELRSAARAQTAMTHRDPIVIDSAELLADVLWLVLRGEKPTGALEAAAADRPTLKKAVENGLQSAGRPTRETIKKFGQMCETPAALPSVVHLVATHENDLKTALVENVMAGGDSAARGMAVGMILGAHLGRGAIPDPWLQGLKAGGRIAELLDKLG
ncbi:MAG: ADP-ribosylglycohydrolase family protein [Desulfobacterales bacterium]